MKYSVIFLQPKSSCSDDGAVTYELMASVAHIRDNKLGNNLVSHIHVGETYHQRKEGVTTTQFYLFNDFSIVDIEKVSMADSLMCWYLAVIHNACIQNTFYVMINNVAAVVITSKHG